MSDTSDAAKKHICLTPVQAARLSRLAQEHQMTEDAVVGRALDILFHLSEIQYATVVKRTDKESRAVAG